MKAAICLLSAVWFAAAAPPSGHRQFLPQPSPHMISGLDYYLESPDEQRYYSSQQKQGQVNQEANGAPSRLENADPNSEVELVPGYQSPQQPQQNPVYPQVPGVAPGQRVFIVHMPIPGYRPGTIGGYQPVYIVAAAPQGNAGYPDGSYLQDPTGQAAFFYRGQGQVNRPLVSQGQGVNPNYFIGPQGQAVNPGLLVPQGQNPGLLVPQGQNPGLLVAQGQNPSYLVSPQGQNLGLLFGPAPLVLNQQDRAVAYQPAQNPLPSDNGKNQVRLSQLVTLQGQVQHPKNTASKEVQPSAEPKRDDEPEGSKESSEPRRNGRPGPQARPKA